MTIRFAGEGDIPALIELLKQVNLLHHNGRPDIFKLATKYTADDLKKIIGDSARPVLVAEDGGVCGYAFCEVQDNSGDNMLTDIKTLYIDDLCVDSKRRRQGIGRALFDRALALAKERGCYNVTLNVWALNPAALKFYESCGMTPLKTYMEKIL